jgi:hypothetical protein
MASRRETFTTSAEERRFLQWIRTLSAAQRRVVGEFLTDASRCNESRWDQRMLERRLQVAASPTDLVEDHERARVIAKDPA